MSAVSPEEQARLERALGRQLATLTLSGLGQPTMAGALQAVAWWNALARLGMGPPLFVVHDLGLLLSRPQARAGAAPVSSLAHAEAALDLAEPRVRYEALLRRIATSASVEALAGTFLRDEVVAVLLARLLGESHQTWAARTPGAPALSALPLASGLYSQDPAVLARAFDPAWAHSFIPALLEREVAVLARLDQLDLGPIRLLGFFAPGGAAPDLADLQQLLGGAGVGDAADFCLQLLPSLLETKRRGAPQTFAVDGFASVERRGTADNLLPSELAHDSEMFAVRTLSDELLYYGHERPQEGARRVHGILIDASASMRGVREVFARGLGLALAKKLSLTGTDVWLRFFDSRLHRKVSAAELGGQQLPYVLCFRSERGRNYSRVFADLVLELQRERAQTKGAVSLTFITHAECHIPRRTVEALGRLAHLYGVFVLPSQPLALEYLPLLQRHQVVTAETLSRPAEKRRRALEIVGDVVAASDRS